MFSLSDIKDIFKGILLIEGYKDMNIEFIYIDKFNDFEKFVNKNGINSIFYDFNYLTIEDFLIENEATDKHLDKKIDDMNKIIKNIDFSRPESLDLFVVHQGFLITHTIEDDWIKGEIDFDEIDSINLSIYAEKEQAEFEELDILKDELLQYIRDDDDFILCKTLALRENYIEKFLDNDEYYGFRELLFDSDDDFYYNEVVEMVEDLYRELKKRNK